MTDPVHYGLWDTRSDNWVREWTGMEWQPVVRTRYEDIQREKQLCGPHTQILKYLSKELP